MSEGCHEPNCVHDHHLYAWEVDWDQRTLVLHTRSDPREAKPIKHVDVVFSGLVAHLFEHDMPAGNIVFDVSEVDLDALLEDEREVFERGRAFVWPAGLDFGSIDELATKLQARRTRAFSVEASMGLSGWVLAVDMQFVESPHPRERTANTPT